jgi:predicted RNA-binding protein YlqC (UPF0109 family)
VVTRSTGQARTKAFIEQYLALVTQHPEQVTVAIKETPHRFIPTRVMTTFLVSMAGQRDAAFVIGLDGKNIRLLRELVQLIASKHGFTPAWVEILDPLRTTTSRTPSPGDTATGADSTEALLP